MIFISAGHYPQRPGACYHEFCEHSEAVRWAFETHAILKKSVGDRVVIVPTGTLRAKTAFINVYPFEGASICAEIHFNSAMKDGRHIGEGCETLFMPESQKGAYMANAVQEALVEKGGYRDRGIKEGWYRMNRLNGANYFLSKTLYPAVIIEPEFIQHVERIQSTRGAGCEAIAESLLNVYQEFNGGKR